MDYIDVDQVLVVPDTPDRLLRPPVLRNCDRFRIRTKSDDAVINRENNRIASKDYSCETIRSQEREKENLNTRKQRLFVRPDSCGKSVVFSTSNNVGQSIDDVRNDQGKDLCVSDVGQSIRRLGHRLTEKNVHRRSGVSRENGDRKGVVQFNGFPKIASGSYELNSIDRVPGVDRGKGVGFIHVARRSDESKASTSLESCTTSKVPQKRMLVRNGCISPCNVAKMKTVAAKRVVVDLEEEKRNDSGAPASESRSNSIVKANDIPVMREIHRLVREKRSDSGALASGSQSSVVDIKDLVAEAIYSSRYKGKGVSHHPSSQEPAAESSRLSHRRLVFKIPADKSSDSSVDTPRCSAETQTLRTLHNKRKQRDDGQQKIMQTDHRIGRDIEHRDDGVPQLLSPDANNLRINRQRKDSASRNSGKRPISCIVDTAAEPSSSRSKRNKNLSATSTSNPVSVPSADSSIRSLQIEADEMLARELQEQLYAEEPTPAVANAERLGMPEALTAIAELRMSRNLLQVGREFNEDDYEMLLSLDEDNHQHGGATPAQINNLPVSVVQVETSQECAICLEIPSVGETIRLLPCLHRFHKGCIDQWLGRKTSCPVCKYSIT
uniref:uncharacterized protein LOC122581730 n=1 Tax=Erigeron canadensis TaxID=72917 RepID=UPI001CB8E59C|nr:uncharacterized protein LOC122581730 [Erigeron canadensis]